MPAKQTLYYRRRRAALVMALGNRCAMKADPYHICVGELEIDHMLGRTYKMRRLSSSSRVARLWREYMAGVPLRLLCQVENHLDGSRRGGYAAADARSATAPVCRVCSVDDEVGSKGECMPCDTAAGFD